jgi:spoIIIJ-associated protein
MAQQTLQNEVRQFVADVTEAMGLQVEVVAEHLDDGGLRIDIRGDDGSALLQRKGEALDALQHIVNTAYRHDGDSQRIVVDCQNFRRGKDLELQQMAKFLIDKAKSTKTPQELGPLNSYARRVVHMEVARDPEVTSESQGDGQMKLVIIAPRAAR